MSRSIVVAARAVGQVHQADWSAAGNLLLAILWKCVGVILLLAAAGLTVVAARPGAADGHSLSPGTILIGLVAALTVIQIFHVQRHVSQLIVVGLIVVIALVIPACALLARSFRGGWLDAALWIYWAGELGLAAILWRLSTGGWFNYALQAVVVGCVLTARALARALDGASSWRPLLPVALAVAAVPAFAWTDLNQVVAQAPIRDSGSGAALEGRESALVRAFFRRPARCESCPRDGSTWFTTPGFIRFSSQSAWPSHDRSGSKRLLLPALFASWPPRRVVPRSTG